MVLYFSRFHLYIFQTVTNSGFIFFFFPSWNSKCDPKPWSIRSLYQQTHRQQHEGYCSGSEKCARLERVKLAHVWIKARQPPGLRLDFVFRKTFILNNLYIWKPFKKGSEVGFCWCFGSINGQSVFAVGRLIRLQRLSAGTTFVFPEHVKVGGESYPPHRLSETHLGLDYWLSGQASSPQTEQRQGHRQTS